MNLHIEPLDPIEAPLSQQFWAGFSIGLGIVYAALFVVLVLLRKRG